MSQQYKTEIYNAWGAFLIVLVFFVIGFATIFWLALTFDSDLIVAGGITLLFLSPILFVKKVKQWNTKKAILEFNDEGFSIIVRSLRKDFLIKERQYKWREIGQYKIYFTPSKLTYLDIYLRNGSYKEFGFRDNKDFEESNKEESVFSVFNTFVKAYNSNKESKDKIVLTGGFLVSKKGLILLVLIGILILIDSILLIKRLTSYPLLIIGVSIFISLLIKRYIDNKVLKSMSANCNI